MTGLPTGSKLHLADRQNSLSLGQIAGLAAPLRQDPVRKPLNYSLQPMPASLPEISPPNIWNSSLHEFLILLRV